ncbi:MAG: aromatic amino acid hydroxylase [Halioglobus sp.]
MNQQEIIASLPIHLRPFVKIQDYDLYTPQDQAVWRFLLKQLSQHLAKCAHPVYLEGLKRTGIALDHIPSIDEMNVSLAALGWRAVVVDGFVPPAIFMEFQALKVLVIALDMRSVDHIMYTPAPDIVHEAAGHAPFIVDVDYAEFLQRFGEVGMKAISSQHDLDVYEAIRQLSVVKENPASTALEIDEAEAHLQDVLARDEEPSEATLLSRLHWWTVEYGLVGELDDYRIFGAGLLSSLGESVHCLDDEKVQKIPLTVDAVTANYDITSEQDRLYVTKSCKHLSQVLNEFAASMCFERGGADSIRVAIKAKTICTAEYDSGVQLSGVFSELLCDAVGNPTYLRTVGPTQLAWKGIEIPGQGIDQHPEGFGSPIGKLKDFNRCLSEYTFDELKAHSIEIGKNVQLEFLSGVTVTGELRAIHRHEHKNLLLSFEQCSVTDLQGRILFEPSWGVYDMTVGATIDSVFGGAADRNTYRLYREPSNLEVGAVVRDEALMELYRMVAAAAGDQRRNDLLLATLQDELLDYPDEWLLRVEILTLPYLKTSGAAELRQRLRQELDNIGTRCPDKAELIQRALSSPS